MGKEREIVEAVVRACRLMRAFYHPDVVLTLGQLVERTALSKTTAHRLLQSLMKGGMIERVGKGGYRILLAPLALSPFKIGYAAQKTNSEFSRDVTESLQRAATREHVQLIAVDNRLSAKAALRNADLLIKEGVNLVLEFQTYVNVAPIISSKFLEAGIPVIAIDIPHPGAIYFGANNYKAGVIGGRALAQWAKENWDGKVDELLLLELPIAGPLPQLRVTGIEAALGKILSRTTSLSVVRLDGRGDFDHSFEVVRRHLRRRSAKRTLIAAVNDPSALGALRAFEEAGRANFCAVMGQNATRDARHELRQPGSRLIGSVAYFPERYGEELMPIALAILQKKPIPSAVYVKHQLITSENVELVYPGQTD